jgi:hypothetical protein
MPNEKLRIQKSVVLARPTEKGTVGSITYVVQWGRLAKRPIAEVKPLLVLRIGLKLRSGVSWHTLCHHPSAPKSRLLQAHIFQRKHDT